MKHPYKPFVLVAGEYREFRLFIGQLKKSGIRLKINKEGLFESAKYIYQYISRPKNGYGYDSKATHFIVKGTLKNYEDDMILWSDLRLRYKTGAPE